ncbi:MAG: glycosyl hydrolase family 95 catalytic domain-containing protein [Lachnospiraceae bacterium]
MRKCPSGRHLPENPWKYACATEEATQDGGCGWIINLYAILGEGEKAYEYLKVMLKRSTYPNLWDDCPPFQIDGNFGGAAGIANMLAQDRNGKVMLLPAIPKEWKNGSVRGLRIKNGRAVDIRWENGEIVESRIYPVED